MLNSYAKKMYHQKCRGGMSWLINKLVWEYLYHRKNTYINKIATPCFYMKFYKL